MMRPTWRRTLRAPNAKMLMIIILLLALILLGALWVFLMHRAVIYALPCAVGFLAGDFVYTTGAGMLSAVALGVLSAISFFKLMQSVFQRTTSVALRWTLAAVFSAPASFVAYDVVGDLCRLAGSNEAWTLALSIAAAAYAAATALPQLMASGDREA